MTKQSILKLSDGELKQQFGKGLDYSTLITNAGKYDVNGILNRGKGGEIRPYLRKLRDVEDKIHKGDIYMAFMDYKRAIREYSQIKDGEEGYSEAQRKILAIQSIDPVPFTGIGKKEERLVWGEGFLDKQGNVVFDYNGVRIVTNNLYPWINYSPHQHEQDVVGVSMGLSPLVNPLYVVNGTSNSHNLLMFLDIEDTTNQVKSILRKTFEGSLLSRFPADRTDNMVIDIIDSELSKQARSIELFGRVSKIYQTGILVPENSTIEARLVSTNHLVKHPTTIPMSALYTIDWERYTDTERFRELRAIHRERYEQNKSNLPWRATINP